MKTMSYDSVIIGFGKGGKTLAGTLAKRGEQVALIEKSSGMYGGTCINVGCIPSKSLYTSADRAKRQTADFEEKAAAYAAAIAEKRRVTALLRGKNYHKLADLPNVDVIDGTAAFEDEHTLRVAGADEELLVRGEKIFINTGADPVVPPIPGVNGPRVYTSETLMELDELPRRLTIIGGGYIGMEFASMYQNFGSTVTVVQNDAAFLPREDADVAAVLKEMLEKRGVRFLFSAKVTGIDADASLRYEQDGEAKILPGDAVLVAIGRKPATAALAAEKAGVRLTPRGAVETDDQLRTSVPHIYAMGDVVGGLQFTYISLDDFRIVNDALTGGPRRLSDRKNVPYSVFLDPPLSRVGMTEAEARAKGIAVRAVSLSAAQVPKAQVLGETEGMLKAVVEAATGKILGVSLLCAESYEMVNIVKAAMDLGGDAKYLANSVYTHPTMSEALNDLFGMV